MQHGVQPLAMKRRLQIRTPAPGFADRCTIALPAARLPTERNDALPSASATSLRARRVARVRATFACAALLAFGVALAGCGSSNTGGTAADPADAVPASAALYAGATVRPAGAEKTSALAAGKALTHQADPYLRLLGALQTPGSAQLNYGRDVAPWLGPHAGIFLTSLASSSALSSLFEQGLLGSSTSSAFAFGAGGAQGAIVLDTSNSAKARSFLDTQARQAGAHATSYRGVSYELTSGGVAFGLVDRFAVIGSESGLRAVIETALGGRLAGARERLLEAARRGAVGCPRPHLLQPGELDRRPPSAEGISGLLQALTGAREANISVVPSASSLSIDADTLASGSAGEAGGLLAADPQAAQALGELPGESWLAIGLGHVGATLSQDAQDLQALASLGSTLGGGRTGKHEPASASAGCCRGCSRRCGELGANSAQARHDFASWMGSAGIFASGSSLLELRGAVVIASKNPALSRAAVAELAEQLRKAGGSVAPVSIRGTEAAVGATAERPAGRARHRRRTRLGRPDEVRARHRRSLRGRPP